MFYKKQVRLVIIFKKIKTFFTNLVTKFKFEKIIWFYGIYPVILHEDDRNKRYFIRFFFIATAFRYSP